MSKLAPKVVSKFTEDEVKNAISAANMVAMNKTPFFGSLMLSTEILFNDELPAPAATDGKKVFFNIKKMIALAEAGVAENPNRDRETVLFWTVLFVMTHEILHCAFLHTSRKGDRNHEMWNIACDIAINNMILLEIFKDTIKIPGLCYGDEHGIDSKDTHAEAIYAQLKKNAIQISFNSATGEITISDSAGNQKGSTFKDLGTGSEKGSGGKSQKYSETDLRDHWERQVETAKATAERLGGGAGLGSNPLINQLKDLYEPKIDWKTAIRHWSSEVTREDYNWTRRSRRSVATPFYFPAPYSRRPFVIVAADASGSVSNKEFKQFMSETYGMLDAANCKVRLVMFDGSITYSEMLEGPSDLKLERHGCGGTVFGIVFKHMEELREKPDGIIVFSDGYNCDKGFEEKVATTIPVLWVITSDTPPPNIGIGVRYEEY